jgi:hypothetical protein
MNSLFGWRRTSRLAQTIDRRVFAWRPEVSNLFAVLQSSQSTQFTKQTRTSSDANAPTRARLCRHLSLCTASAAVSWLQHPMSSSNPHSAQCYFFRVSSTFTTIATKIAATDGNRWWSVDRLRILSSFMLTLGRIFLTPTITLIFLSDYPRRRLN